MEFQSVLQQNQHASKSVIMRVDCGGVLCLNLIEFQRHLWIEYLSNYLNWYNEINIIASKIWLLRADLNAKTPSVNNKGNNTPGKIT